jgi:uncharacterized phage-associated protein
MVTCFDVANYFLAKSDPEIGDLISHLKLQKLTYYAQGFSLAILGTPIFQEKIEAWDHGPVVPELYHEFKKNGSNPIFTDLDISKAKEPFSTEQIELLEEVYFVYGQFSAWKLRNMTHEEPTWKNAYYGDCVINKEAMREYFKNLVEDA